MKTLTQILTDVVGEAFEAAGYDKALGETSVSDRPDLCQFQCNGALAGAKKYKKAPRIIAEEVLKILSGNKMFSNLETAGPGFINITVEDEFLTDILKNMRKDKYWGVPQSGKEKTVVLDYGGANVAKPLHIGHLRPAIIGEAIKRLARAFGYNVISDIHLGDWGLQMGLVIAELEERNPDWRCFKEDFNPDTDEIPELDFELFNELYPYASKKSKQNEDFNSKARGTTAALQSGHKGYTALWRAIVDSSIKNMKRIYSEINVEFDLWLGESDAEKYVGELIDKLSNKGLLYESEGAMVVNVSEETDNEPMPPVIIKKSDNSSIYATTDLATLIQREKDFHPDFVWYVVDSRQGLHFKQVFRCAKKAEIVPENVSLEFLNNGTMNGSDGKPYKTRDGGVMSLKGLIETASAEAEKKLRESQYVSGSKEVISLSALKVGVAAVKFGDLINHRAKDYVFDMDKFLSFEGKTGTYILYTVSRINSILRNTGFSGEDGYPDKIRTDSERDLILKILMTPETFVRALNERAPNYISENVYELASLFSKFYHDNHIMNEQDIDTKNDWIKLTSLTRDLIIYHLDILGIDHVESM